ncbi:MAG: hypothetical protein DRP81_01995 [Candidatus Omnitrophota bacterium]|nr:MAG: hypothetical protein DRP81_01995 [Candidatus Omnitrophota bacterium]
MRALFLVPTFCKRCVRKDFLTQSVCRQARYETKRAEDTLLYEPKKSFRENGILPSPPEADPSPEANPPLVEPLVDWSLFYR